MGKKILLKGAIPDVPDIHLIDGRMMLHKISWSEHVTYKKLCQNPLQEVRRNYGNGVIVFDSYARNKTKDYTHENKKDN